MLYDGACGFCSRSVRFVFDRDPEGAFRYASLASEAGRRLLREHGLPEGTLDTVVLIEDGRAHLRSTAALRVARRLRGAWRLLYAFVAVPRPVRDWAYRQVATRRHGLGLACPAPSPELRARMLD